MHDMMYPTLLRTPRLGAAVDDDDVATWPAEHLLPRTPFEYAVANDGNLWIVRLKATNEMVYAGPGPVALVESPAPF